MGEGAAAVAVAHREDAVRTGFQSLVDGDVAAFVRRHARLVEAEVVRVRPPAGGEEDIGAQDLRGACRTIDAGPDAVAGFEEADALRPRADGDALAFEDVAHGGADILVLPGDQPRPLLDDRHVRAEAAEHLGEFQPDAVLHRRRR